MCSRQELQETYTVLDQLIKIAHTPASADSSLIQKIYMHKRDIENIIQKKNQQLIETVIEYQSLVKDLEVKTSNPPSRKFQLQQDIVRGDLRDTEAGIAAYKAQLKDEERVVSHLEEQLSQLERCEGDDGDLEAVTQARDIAHLTAVAQSQVKLAASLCSVVFNEGEEAAGVVHLLHKGEIRPFRFPKHAIQADVANKLWDDLWEEQMAARQP